MRQYRGKRIDNGEWVYGYYVYRNCVNNDTHYIYIRAGKFYQVDPDTVGQEIGLVERNNKAMYFDDIVLWNNKHWVIVWNVTCLGVYLQPLNNYYEKQKDPKIKTLISSLLYGRAVFCERIGTIHDKEVTK